jgi:curved DNA-binding protein CbpA
LSKLKPVSNQSFSDKQKQCLYKILNVSPDASEEELKQSYFSLAKKYHPDTNQGILDKVRHFFMIRTYF